MASAQILQLYYTKDNKSQQGNLSKYHQQRSKPFPHGWQTITIPRKQFQTLPQNKNTFSKLTDYFYSFQSTRTNKSNISANTNENKDESKSNNTITDTRHQLQRHKSILVSTENTIEESGVPKKTTSQQSTSSIIIVDAEDYNKDDEDIEGEDISTQKYRSISTEQQIWWKDIFNFPKDENLTSEDDTTIDAIVADTFDDCEFSLLADPGGVHLYHGCNSITMSARCSDVAKSAKWTLQHHNQLGYSGKATNHFQPKMCSPLPSQSQSKSSLCPSSSSSSSTSKSLLSPSFHSKFHSNDEIGRDAGYEFAAEQVAITPQKIDSYFTGGFKQGKEANGLETIGDKAHQIWTTRESIDLFNGDSQTAFVNFVAIKKVEGQIENEEGMGEKNNHATPTPKPMLQTKPKSTSTTTKTKSTTTGKTTATTTTKKTKNCAICCQNNAPSNTSVAVAGVDKTCFLQKRIDFYRNDSPNEANGCCLLCKFKPNTCQKSKSPECCEKCCQHYVKSELLKLSSEATLGNTYEYEYDQENWKFTNQAKRQQSSNHITSTSECSSSLLLQSTTSGSTTSTTKTTTTTRTTLSRLSSKQPCCCNETKRGYESDSKQFQQIHHHQQQQQQQQQNLRQQRTAQLCNFDCQKWDSGKSPLCITNIVATNNSNKSKSISNITNHNVNSNVIGKPKLFGTSKPYDTNNNSHNNSHNNSNSKKFCRKLSENALNTFADVQRFTRAILPLIIIFNILPLLYAECDQTFVSRVGGPQNGTFSAPLIHNPKNHSRQCLYIFLAGPGQRVEVVFTTFNLRGSPPDGSAVGELPTCVHEYMDIYSEVQSSDPADLINSPFGGRFCGTIPPRGRISMHRAIAISFFTNKNVTEPDLFEGYYRFLSASEYEIGIPIAGSPCSYTITPSMSINKTGALISPTYPGAYPKDMSCTYQFLGETNQRVRLEFRDFDLFFGGPHCPFDYVKVYDGPDNSSALIGTYCGQQRNLVLYSSESSLFVHFYTLPRTANTQNRGFKGIYEFSESFVKLDFIRENDGIHIRGSECDQKILSKKESTGFVLSPNYPYPYIPKTVCRYFIYGMQDAQHLERVRLEFSAFNIPKVEHKDKSESNCTDGYLKIYLKGQETADAYDKFDYELCGNETQRVVSDGPRLAMVFSSGELQGRGFKGKYTFETEYKIPGTAAPDGTCSFTYMSNSKKRGELNSPRYPSNYPSETNCTYLFLAEPNEQVTIVFDHFKVKADNANSTAGAYGASACFEDWLEMYVIYRDNNDRFLGRYCGLTAPGPVESPRGAVGLRITLHTDQENVASGFKARYYFETTKSDVGDCGGNFSNEDSGIITSPHYPSNYKSPAKGMASMACNWYMTARPGYKLSINFEHFSVEGDPMARGCPAAVLRMWTNVDSEAPPIELCGEKPPTEHWHYITTGQSARISFTTTDKTIGAQGFRIVWTEIQDSGPGPPAIGLLCESTYHFQCNVGYCISDKLRCDGIKNCGPGDDSDEMHCESYHGSSQRGSRRSNYNQHGRRLVPNLSPMHTLSSPKKTPT